MDNRQIGANGIQTQAANRRIKVLYVLSAARSGSTLISVLLNQLPGFFAVSEIINLWNNLLNPELNITCGCGCQQDQCSVWGAVFQTAYDGLDKVDLATMLRAEQQLTKTSMKNLVLPGRRRRLLERSESRTYLENTEKLYGAIQQVTSSQVIVDASKGLLYLKLLQSLPSLEVYVLHILRDPRGAVYSQISNPGLRRKHLYKNRWSQAFALGGFRWSRQWFEVEMSARNSQWDGKFMQVRLEDFILRPKEILAQVIDFIGESSSTSIEQIAFTDDQRVILSDNHTIGGNRMRFQRGLTELRLDEKWKAEMKPFDKMLVNLFTWPVLLKYGYPLFPAQPKQMEL